MASFSNCFNQKFWHLIAPDESDSDDSIADDLSANHHTAHHTPNKIRPQVETDKLPKILKAIDDDDLETFKTLLTDENVVKVDNLQNSPIHYAVMLQRIQMVELLIAHPKVDLNVLNCFHVPPLPLAIVNGCKNIFEQLLAANCDVNLGTRFDLPLHLAIKFSDVSWIHELIEKGADVNSIVAHQTPLILAVHRNSVECVCMLLYYGADVTTTDETNSDAFMHACKEYWTPELAQELLPYMTDFSHSDNLGFNCLHNALSCNHPIAQELIDVAYECINSVTNFGCSTIYFTLNYNSCDLFKRVWQKPNFDTDIIQLSLTSFLDYFFNSILTFNDWVEALEIIVNSGCFTKLIQWYSEPHPILTTVLTKVLRHKCSCTFNERVAWLMLFASYGAEITQKDIVEVFNIFGYNQEVKMLLNIEPNPVSTKPVRTHIFLKYVLGLVIIPTSYRQLMKQFVRSVNKDSRLIYETLTLFKYFSVHNQYHYLCEKFHSNNRFLLLMSVIVRRISKKGMVPSLIELSRNVVRRTMFSNNVSWAVISTWQIPEVIKKILRFETPVNIFNVGQFEYQCTAQVLDNT